MQTAIKSKGEKAHLELAFDVGHSSIGWAVFDGKKVELLGCGTVIFPADECLASARRGFRRQRRHIRSTRLRVERLKRLFEHIGVLTRKQLDEPGCAWPWLLAARVLQDGDLLTWPELWDVVRWYAHNRGYDGNRAWSAADAAAADEDTEKVENARALYAKYGTRTMAQTFCAVCGLDPLGDKKSCHLEGALRPTALNAAFPREDVEAEVREVLLKHDGRLQGLNQVLIEVLLKNAAAIQCDSLRLPLRYSGGLLFGQLIPRFENRIIATCPIMFERIYQRILTETGDVGKAKGEAEKLAKVPVKECREYYEYRWAMLLANIQIHDGKKTQPLIANSAWRRSIDERMHACGFLTPGELKELVRNETGHSRDNLDQMFLHPDAGEALVLDPLRKMIGSDDHREAGWQALPEQYRKRAAGKLRKGKQLSLAAICSELKGDERVAVEAAITVSIAAANAKKRKEKLTLAAVLEMPMQIKPLTGRAPYHREIMGEAVIDVMKRGLHPTSERGCLYRGDAIRTAQVRRAIDEQTNNHLVRHRLMMLERLHRDILKEYAGGDVVRVARVTIEVNRELKELSGKTAKQVAQDMGLRLSNFKGVTKKLEGAFAGKGISIGPGLIRKARIAEDLEWTCPYTGKQYDAFDLLNRVVDKDHIVPRSMRASDSLDSLVITYAEINRWKGQRTAVQFIEEEQGKPVPGLPHLSIRTPKSYLENIKKLDTRGAHEDDERRKKNRKRLLQIRDYVEKEFTPRDLTQTSQLVRLGAQALQGAYLGSAQPPVITSIPGSVTGMVRKSWKLLGCLAVANPQVLDENGEVRTKTEIRDITHLHHALDACVLALAAQFLPRDGGIWEMLVKRRLTEQEQAAIKKRLAGMVHIAIDGSFRLADLPDVFKRQVKARLAERRVVQHVPKEMAGMRAEQNAWRVLKVEDGDVYLRQRIRQPDGTRPVKLAKEKVGKVIGLQPGELNKRKAALVISENYGLALDPEPTIIPFHKVWPRIRELRAKNGGKSPRILRNGDLIHVPRGNFSGIWKIFSIKNNATGIALDIGCPDVTRLKNGTVGHKINVRLTSLLGAQMTQYRSGYTGVAAAGVVASRV